MNFKISSKAMEDMESIWLYTFENWSMEQADRYLNLILDEVEYLSQHPESGKELTHIRKNYRCTKVKSHLIFYRKSKNEKYIEVIRVLHQRMDIQQHLKG